MQTKEYTIPELDKKLEQDLLMCNNDFERSMCKAIGGMEIRNKAIELAKHGKLPSHYATIAYKYGYRPIN